LIDNHDREGNAFANTNESHAGCYETRTKVGVCADAYVAKARAEYSIFSAEASALEASAGASYGWVDGLNAGASAKIVWAEADAGFVSAGIGLQLDCGAAISCTGFSVTLFGFGVSFGSKMSFKLPFASVSVSF
jgi:hypothetical protein